MPLLNNQLFFSSSVTESMSLLMQVCSQTVIATQQKDLSKIQKEELKKSLGELYQSEVKKLKELDSSPEDEGTRLERGTILKILKSLLRRTKVNSKSDPLVPYSDRTGRQKIAQRIVRAGGSIIQGLRTSAPSAPYNPCNLLLSVLNAYGISASKIVLAETPAQIVQAQRSLEHDLGKCNAEASSGKSIEETMRQLASNPNAIPNDVTNGEGSYLEDALALAQIVVTHSQGLFNSLNSSIVAARPELQSEAGIETEDTKSPLESRASHDLAAEQALVTPFDPDAPSTSAAALAADRQRSPIGENMPPELAQEPFDSSSRESKKRKSHTPLDEKERGKRKKAATIIKRGGTPPRRFSLNTLNTTFQSVWNSLTAATNILLAVPQTVMSLTRRQSEEVHRSSTGGHENSQEPSRAEDKVLAMQGELSQLDLNPPVPEDSATIEIPWPAPPTEEESQAINEESMAAYTGAIPFSQLTSLEPPPKPKRTFEHKPGETAPSEKAAPLVQAKEGIYASTRKVIKRKDSDSHSTSPEAAEASVQSQEDAPLTASESRAVAQGPQQTAHPAKTEQKEVKTTAEKQVHSQNQPVTTAVSPQKRYADALGNTANISPRPPLRRRPTDRLPTPPLQAKQQKHTRVSHGEKSPTATWKRHSPLYDTIPPIPVPTAATTKATAETGGGALSKADLSPSSPTGGKGRISVSETELQSMRGQLKSPREHSPSPKALKAIEAARLAEPGISEALQKVLARRRSALNPDETNAEPGSGASAGEWKTAQTSSPHGQIPSSLITEAASGLVGVAPQGDINEGSVKGSGSTTASQQNTETKSSGANKGAQR